MQGPSEDSGIETGSGDGGAASQGGSSGSGGAGGIAAAGGATATGGAGGANAGGGAGLASTGGAGGGNVGGGAGRANTGGIGGQTNTGGVGGTNTGGVGGRPSTGGAGGVSVGGNGGATTGGTGGTSSGGVGGTVGGTGGAGGGTGGAGGQVLPPLFAFYAFDQTAGPTIPDSSGNGHGGTLAGAATFPAGVIGNGLSLPGVSGDYVALPGGLLQTVTSVSITMWVNVRADQTWQRVFDFGSSSNVYMFLTPHAGGTSIARFAISTTGNTNEQRLDATNVLPVGTWTHVAIVLGASGGTLYINGAAVGTNAALTLRPTDLGATTNDWIGRSQFTADPSFNGQIDELRIYASALTAGQITTIYNAR